MTKQAARITKKIRAKYRFQKIKLCKKCHRYSVLMDKTCPECGSTYIGIESQVKSMVKKRLFTGTLRMVILVSTGTAFAPTSKSLTFSMIAGLMFCLGYVTLSLIFLKSKYFIQLKKLLRTDLKKIAAGIRFDSDLANEDVKEGRLASAYEKLRDIGDFIYHDRMKIRRVRVLNKMALRSDMKLELEPLIPSSYDRDFVKYALEIVKINRKLITKKCISYFIHYRDAIVIDFGMDSLMAVAGTALRMKLYILEFSSFIEEVLDYLPKERVLRLCNMIHNNSGVDWGSLKDSTERLAAKKYRYDSDFRRFVFNERTRNQA